jgi:signal transduction histidine kinase
LDQTSENAETISIMILDEQARLEALWAYDILDTPAEEDYDEIVKLASSICGVPISLITLIDTRRQWYKASIGIVGSETPREYAFCAHAIEQDDIMVVHDATKDERFKDNPYVLNDPDIRFYAGMPLRTPGGHNLGTLCVIDTVPRELNEQQLMALQILSRQVINNLEMRIKVKQLKETLRTIDEQKSKLTELNNHNARLLSIIGHDVRNPLAALQSMLQLMADGDISAEDVMELSGELAMQVESSIDLLNNLVEWGIRSRHGDIKLSEIRLVPIVENTLMASSLPASAKNNTLKFEPIVDVSITADDDMVRFILRNLVQNANKFTQSGTITIGMYDKGDFIHVSVSDTGRGMKEADMDRMFDWNRRRSVQGTNGEIGSGLGLLLCKEFITKLGGDLMVKSVEGEGSTFTMVLKK